MRDLPPTLSNCQPFIKRLFVNLKTLRRGQTTTGGGGGCAKPFLVDGERLPGTQHGRSWPYRAGSTGTACGNTGGCCTCSAFAFSPPDHCATMQSHFQAPPLPLTFGNWHLGNPVSLRHMGKEGRGCCLSCCGLWRM